MLNNVDVPVNILGWARYDGVQSAPNVRLSLGHNTPLPLFYTAAWCRAACSGNERRGELSIPQRRFRAQSMPVAR